MAKLGNKMAGGLVAAAIIIVAGFWFISSSSGGSVLQSIEQNQADLSACPTDGDTSFKLEVRNGQDDTANTEFDVTAYLFSDGDYQEVTDTTNPSAATVNCGEEYTLRLISADGNRGDNARIVGIEDGDATLNADGSVTFTPTKPSAYLKVVGSFHGVEQFRVWSVDNGAWRYKGSVSSLGNSNDWQLTGTIFNGTTSENSTISVGTGGSFTDEMHFKANETVTNGADFGYYVLVDAATAKFNEPTLTLNGVRLTKLTGGLPPDENRQYGATYEYAYKVSADITDADNVLKTEFKAVSGVDPTYADSPTVAIAPIGAFVDVDSNYVLYGAAKNDASATAVFTVQTAKLAIV